MDFEQPLQAHHIEHLMKRPVAATIERYLDDSVRELVQSGVPIKQAMRAFEKKYLDVALELYRGNVTKAAVALGVHRNTITKKKEPSLRALARRMRAKKRR